MTDDSYCIKTRQLLITSNCVNRTLISFEHRYRSTVGSNSKDLYIFIEKGAFDNIIGSLFFDNIGHLVTAIKVTNM